MGRRNDEENDGWWQAQELIERQQYEEAEREKEQAQLRADPAFGKWLDKLDNQTKQQETVNDDDCK